MKDEKADVRDFLVKSVGRHAMAGEKSRLDCLVEIVDHCTSAKEIAESMGETFLAYMLAMSIQAVREEMRPKVLRRPR